MKSPEIQEQARKIAEAALKRTKTERKPFVDDACQGDSSLRNQVTSLLNSTGDWGLKLTNEDSPLEREWQEIGPGFRIGHYRLERQLGQGGMGAVFLASRADSEFDMQVAIKVLKRGIHSEAIIRRFRNERQILARLRHPNIAGLLDGGTTGAGLPYFIMEFVEGETIAKFCRNRGLSVPERLLLFCKVCTALSYAHQNGVVHRDIKPGNIVVTADFEPKLLDFGIARLPQEEDETALTVPGQVLMTPEYASPEQVRGEAANESSDIYSLGALLYQILTGRRPREARDGPIAEIKRILAGDLSTIVAKSSTEAYESHLLSGDLGQILLRAVAEKPEDRYASVALLLDDLEEYRAGRAMGKMPKRRISRLGRLFHSLREKMTGSRMTREPETSSVPTLYTAEAPGIEAQLAPGGNPDETLFFVDIQKQGNQCRGWLQRDNPYLRLPLEGLKLGPEDEPTLESSQYKLGDLVRAITEFDETWLMTHMGEAAQYELGSYLYRQLFGSASPTMVQGQSGRLTIFIRSEIPFIAMLPWSLLAHHGVFLCNVGWSMLLSGKPPVGTVELPPSPHILILAPQPDGVAQTGSKAHLESLEELLSSVDRHHISGQHLNIVTHWSDFVDALPVFQPHIVYYYGLLEKVNDRTVLVCADDENQRLERNGEELASALADAGELPLLAYFNCPGSPRGQVQLMNELESLIPAVAVTRTAVSNDLAHKQGMTFWRRILLDGKPPHVAVTETRIRTDTLGPQLDTRWATPMLHASYARWLFQPPKAPGRLERDPHWHIKLDRVSQFSQVFLQTYEMFQERKPRSLAYLWYGGQDQGIELFHQRLRVDLQEKLKNVIVFEVQPEWPADMVQPHRSLSDMITQAFRVESLDQVPARIRTFARGAPGREVLVYVRHLPIKSGHIFHPHFLKTYLEWWDVTFIPHLPKRAFALLGISYEVKNPARFRKLLVEKEGLPDLEMRDTVFQLLDELDKIIKQDLLRFIKTHNIRLPEDRKNSILDEIIMTTGGIYERVLEELKELEARAWALGTAAGRTSLNLNPDEDDYDDVI